MLFDLQSGKRRRLVQVVYTLLAVSFLIGFVIFGVGSSGLGGIGDIFGSGGSSSGSGSSQYQTQIDAAVKRVQKDPKDEKALTELANLRYLAGAAEGDVDSTTGQINPSDATLNEWNQALDAWEQYLKLDPSKVPLSTGGQMLAAYQGLNQLGTPGAIETQKSITTQTKDAGNYATLAYLYYLNGDIEAGDQAADQAVAAAKGKDAEKIRKQLDKLSQQATAAKKQAQKSQGQSATGSSQLQNPFGSLGGSTGTVPPAP